jgi:hypothetical protein
MGARGKMVQKTGCDASAARDEVNGAQRYIAELKFNLWHGRLYYLWSASSGGDEAFKSVMHRIETVIGPSARDLDDFINRSKNAFQKAGFSPFAP